MAKKHIEEREGSLDQSFKEDLLRHGDPIVSKVLNMALDDKDSRNQRWALDKIWDVLFADKSQYEGSAQFKVSKELLSKVKEVCDNVEDNEWKEAG